MMLYIGKKIRVEPVLWMGSCFMCRMCSKEFRRIFNGLVISLADAFLLHQDMDDMDVHHRKKSN